MKSLLFVASLALLLGSGHTLAQNNSPGTAGIFNPFAWAGTGTSNPSVPTTANMNPLDPMSWMGMMMGQPRPGAMNLARPEGWTVFLNPATYPALMNPATYAQFMQPGYYMQFADPNNWMAWMNPASYGAFMNPMTYMTMMNPMGYMQLMNPYTYMQWMNPGAYAAFVDPGTYMQWMNPAAYSAGSAQTPANNNFFDFESWAGMFTAPAQQ